ncbi:MAG: helix-turn-helix domain-containing protein [Haloarculaceae archaeon]
MRYLEVSVAQSPGERNPMHQFVVERDAYGPARLLHREAEESSHAMLVHVEGPTGPYREALEARDAVQAFELSPCPDDSFYLYVREDLAGEDRAFASAFSQPGLLLLTPVEYRTDGTVRLTAVGPAEAVQAAVEDVPETMGVEVVSVGEYAAGRVDARQALTQRQFEAVRVAVETGYYRSPREATLSAVAARLDCATGTAGELLRRAERTVMADLVAGGPF